MPEGAETIRDLLTGFNSLAMHVGITPMSFQNQGFQSPTTPMPELKHPGQLSMELQQMGTQQFQQATQQLQSLRAMPAPGVLGLRPGGLPPDLGQPPRPVSAAAGAFSSQYQARMQDIESRYLAPHQAQSYARGAGQAGFSQMPSPVFQTAPSMGIFRPQTTQPPPMQLARESPMIPTPFTPQLPTPRFQTTAEMQYQQRAVDDERMFAATMAAAPLAANVAGNLAAGGIGAGVARHFGGRLGGAIGGARGRAIGQMGGMIAGGIGGLFMGAGDVAERGMEAGVVEPVMRRRAMGRQLERMSENFVVGGPDMNQVTGRGLSAKASIRLAGGMQQDVEEGQTGGFNMRDMMRITGMASQGGMLDMAQSGEQIRSQVRNVARGLQSFMQIAQEPDVQRAMQQMSSMRTMGLTIPETNMAMRNAQTFARMAGTTVQGIQEQAGRPGAMMFQQQGLTAGLGMQVGHASAAMARQAVAGGAFTPGQLTMAGGEPGLTQSLTEAGAAGLGIDFPMLAMLERGGPGGQLSINRERAQQIMRGELSLSQQAQLGAQNVQDLGGESVITELSTRLNELRDELGRTLGPQSTALMTMRQATNLMGEVPGLTFGGALKQLGLGQQQARSLEVMGQSGGFWQGLRDQHETNIRQLRADERARRDSWQEKSSLSSRFGRWWDERGVLDRPGEVLRGASQAISEWWTDRGAAQDASERGAQYVARDRDLEVENERQSRALQGFIGTEGFQRFQGAYGAELNRGTGRATATTGQALGGLWNTALDVGSTALGFSNPILGFGASFLTDPLRSSAGTESNYAAALKARGGVTGALGGTFASLATLAGGTNPLEARRADTEARQAAQMGRILQSGADLTGRQKATITQDLRTAYKEYGQAAGVTVSDEKDRMGVMVQAAVKRFEENASWYGDEAVTSGEMKTDMIEALVASGEDRQVATKFVNEKFNSGLGAVVMNKAKPLLSEKAKASYAKTEKAVGYEGKLAGSDLKAVQENAAKLVDEVKEATGFYEGIDSSDKAWTAFKDQVTTGSTEEMLMMSALAQGAWGADESEEGARLRKLLTKKLGPERVDQLRDAAAAKLEGVEDTDMFREFGKRLGREGQTFKGAAGTVKGIASKFKGTQTRTAIARGATKWREAGITAFEGMFDGGGIEGVLAKLREDPEQIKQLRKQSPELARALEGVVEAESPEARQAAEQKVLQNLFRTGGGGRKTGGEFGGKGVGGAAERKEREQMGLEERIQASIKEGKPGEAFAQAIPAFAKATTELGEATEDLKKTIIASKLAFRLPGFG